MRLVLTACLAWLIALASAQAAYIGSPIAFQVINGAGQPVGTVTQGLPPIPLQTAIVPPFATYPTPPYIVGKNALYPDTTGRNVVSVTDGVNMESIAPAFRGAGPAQPGLVVSLSPNPTLQCPLTAAINISANATVITNPGGKNLHVCAVVLINGGTAQSVTLLEGTGTACATNPLYWLGGSGATAALAVSGGFSVPGSWINFPMLKAGDNVCVLVSGSTNVSGTMTYGVFP